MDATQVLNKIQWSLDPAHSEIGFKVKHLMVSTVRGKFTDYSGTVSTAGDNFLDAAISISIKASSVNTGNEMRDGHLKSPEFFDVEHFGEITFQSNSLHKFSESEYVIRGNLTIKGTTQNVKLDVEFNGFVKDPYGNRKAGFEVTGKISRKDFGLTYNAALETGGVVVGDEISIKCEVTLIQQA